jgi:hypothetical protein
MRKIALPCASLAAMLTVALPSVSAQAQFYVASNGSGTACTLAAPCRTFQAAHDAAVSGREIKCLTAGDYAEVIVTKSITIDCTGTGGAIIASGNAVTVHASTPGLVVTLRGLDLQGVGLGPAAVDFAASGELHVENCRIAGWQDGGVGKGIAFHPGSGTGTLFILDSIIEYNGLSASGGGIVVEPTGSASANVTIQGAKVGSNTYGIFANGMGSTGQIIVQIKDSAVANSTFDGISAYTAHSTTAIVVDHSSSLLNGGNGILSQGSGGIVIHGNSTVMSNGTGLKTESGGSIFSYQNNQLTGNVTDGAPTAVFSVK